MAVPDFQTLMLPTLREIVRAEIHTAASLRAAVAREMNLTAKDLEEQLPSGRQTKFQNRIDWAKTYMQKAGLVPSPQRGTVVPTERGRALLAEGPTQVDIALLSRFSEFVEWRQSSARVGNERPAATLAQEAAITPLEALLASYEELRADVLSELRDRVAAISPAGFERLVLDLLINLGYGGALGTGRHLGRSADGGVDGVIEEDRLGLEVIYVQAKRWTATVGRPDVQTFAGSLEGFRARKGVFITTSNFSSEARDYVTRIDKRIVLIDGAQLVDLMFRTGLGVITRETLELKEVDSDSFIEA